MSKHISAGKHSKIAKYTVIILLLLYFANLLFIVELEVTRHKSMTANEYALFKHAHGDNNDDLKRDYPDYVQLAKMSHNRLQRDLIKIVDMAAYLKSFDNVSLFHACSDLQRPKHSELHLWKEVYQHMVLRIKEDSKVFDAYLKHFYFDDRFHHQTGERLIRTIVSVKGPCDVNVEKYQCLKYVWKILGSDQHMLFWYDGFANPVIALSCTIQKSGGVVQKINGSFHYQFIITCPIPEIQLLPAYASLVTRICDKPTIYTKIVYPQKNEVPYNREIGLCVHPIFRTLRKSDVPYIVNWIETLKLFGVREISLSNTSAQLKEDLIKSVFKYYVDSGVLKLTQYPVILPEIEAINNRKAGWISMKQMAVLDCVYRNIKRYWYVLIHNIDEIVIPRQFGTFVEYLENYVDQFQNTSSGHCLAIRSAYFYKSFSSARNQYPRYMILLKKTKRFAPESTKRDYRGRLAVVRGFSKMHSSVSSDTHLCTATYSTSKELEKFILPVEEIMVHHYRMKCKMHFSNGSCNSGHADSKLYEDNTLLKYGDRLTDEVTKVLKTIGYI